MAQFRYILLEKKILSHRTPENILKIRIFLIRTLTAAHQLTEGFSKYLKKSIELLQYIYQVQCVNIWLTLS